MPKKNNRTEDGKIVIKKYGNRRLYSTYDSRYLTLKELEELVRNGENIIVIDVATEEDITSQVLTQILVEGDQAGKIPVQFLQKVIRQGDSFLDGFLERQSNRIEKSMDTAMKTQTDMIKMFQQMMTMGNMMQNPFFAMMQQNAQQDPKQKKDEKDEEIRKLRERIEKMEKEIQKDRK